MTKHIRTLCKAGALKRREAISLLLLATLFPSLAFAASPFAGGTTGLSADILTIVAPIAGLALIAVGVICWFGKISWLWFGGLVIGIVLVFGNQQVVSWIRGLFGV
ncbi:TrbC/VirB2 family protein [Glaciimonas sp. GNP009]|uniref:TrbC/VirB2 family protein n=1 Tax=Glaciimonas sp. Cout2 TaxID=3048621 RepID=UPI002B22BD95|nr:TrbC/VirB2 family protein [Glaciimonas sp. Cout2]MEB0014538.1 TrbC/VirB2 family protein [Glaciimonas sp. Cout2]